MARYPEMNWDTGDTAEDFQLFKQRMELCLTDNDVVDKKKQANKIKIYVGTAGLKRINASGLSDNDKEDPDKLWLLFENQLKIKVNFRIHRLELSRYRQKADESIDDFVGRCRAKAKDCDFEKAELSERVIELVIKSTPFDSYQKELLEKIKGYPLEDLVTVGRRYEAIAEGGQRLTNIDRTNVNVDAVSGQQECSNCGLQHHPQRCPAYRDTCKKCGATGHWAKKCRGGRRANADRHTDRWRSPSQGRRANADRQTDRWHSPSQGRRANAERWYSPSQRRGRPEPDRTGGRGRRRTRGRRHHQPRAMDHMSEHSGDERQEQSSIEFYDIKVSDICTQDDGKGIITTIDVVLPRKQGQHKLRLKVDSGAEGNTIPIRVIKTMYPKTWRNILQPTNSKLTAYNGTTIQCAGSLDIVCHYSDQEWSTHKFYAVETPGAGVLGWPSINSLRVLSINGMKSNDTHRPPMTIRSVEDLKREYPDRFDAIGSFKGKARIHLKPDAKPYIDAPRKCSVHIKPKLAAELRKMEEQGIIRKIKKHTDWCSSMTTTVKKDGSLRMCLDPKRLNDAVKRCPHKIPTLEELNPEFSQAKFFSKLDAKAGYWSVHLHEDSQELTTFRTPFGRYCFQRLPFGLCTSQDIFQQRMDAILEQTRGCVGIADDVAVFGKTEQEHDENLVRLMEVAQREGLVFNSSKCVIKAKQVNFFGALYTSNGIKPDPAKVKDIRSMPTPQDKEDLQTFLGMITYLGSFIPNLAERAQPLRDLLKQNVPFVWQEDHQATFDALKQSISTESCLQYFDPTKATTIEVDASQKGLGACLVQDDKPVAFASTSLTTAQRNYANIERETLAMVYGVNKFHTYVFGKEFTLISDHKPLEMIWRKPLGSAPPRLQRMLVKLQGYDVNVKYRPGKTMVLADALSRLPNPQNTNEIPLDVGVDYVEIDDNGTPTEIAIDLVNFGSSKQEELRRETANDTTLHAVKQTVQEGWPGSMSDLPAEVRPYWSFRDEIGISDGVLFKGRQVLMPTSMRGDILNQLHQAHMGIEKTRRLARESVYWPGINKDIEQTTKNCEACQELQPSQQKEPLQPHEIPSTPWTKLGSDLFAVDRDDFLIITDYYSKYPVVYKLASTKSDTVARTTAALFSLFGVPNEIVTDNGPQYSGQPYQDMCKKWGINHTTSSPRYPRSNGLAERNIRTVKSIIKKCKKTKQDLQIALLNLRATPVDTGIPSPAEMMFGRPVRTTLPSYHHANALQKAGEIQSRLMERTARMKNDHDKSGGPELPPLHVGQKVRVQDHETKSWEPAEVTDVCEDPRSYIVKSPNGSSRRRNRIHIRNMPGEPAPRGERERKRDGTTDKHVRFDTQPEKEDTTDAEVEKPNKPPEGRDKSQNSHSDRIHTKADTKPPDQPYTTVTKSGRAVKIPARYREPCE